MELTAPVSELKLANRELGTVERIAEGRVSVKMDGGREVQLDPLDTADLKSVALLGPGIQVPLGTTLSCGF